jgi:aspartyl-tRNA(Asn)/glutamyl-tRNA(Gln) amidotransferase subunit A
MKINLENLTIEKAHESLKSGEYTVTELVNSYLDVIKDKNTEINAYREIYSDVMDQAKIAEEMFKNGSSTLMTGIPMALKDNMLFDGHIASASSLILENYKATYDSSIVKQLKKQGAVFLGRTNMDEFAMGSSTETSAFGNTKNPLDVTRVPGGSSGGSVAAIAMNGALVSLGSDTGGSIRQPAAFCGLVGLKPTYGTVSRFGIISMGSSLDQVGPFGKTVRDAEILFNAINDYDEKDSTSIKKENRLEPKPLKKKIGVPRSFLLSEGTDPEITKNFEENCKKLEDAGYEIVDVSLPLIKYSLAVYYIICPAEVSSNLARYDGIKYGLHEDGKNLYEVYIKSRGKGFGKEVQRRILLGTYILSHGYYDAYYNTAIKVRDAIKAELTNIFLEVDAIITPTSPVMPFKFGEKLEDPISMYLSDLFSVPANIAGIPAISIPSGKNKDGLPFGFHIMAPFLREDILFTIGKDFEKQAPQEI